MSYPEYPSNRLIVNGVDLTTEFKMVLLDGYTMTPPAPKLYQIDIPGGNGKLDLTESLLGDTAYSNRKQEYVFNVINDADFEQTKTRLSNFLHGKAYDYNITMDAGYTYHGRFSVEEYYHTAYANGIVGNLKIVIDAKPFKLKDLITVKVDAIGGTIVNFLSGRMRVRPKIETGCPTKIIYNNKKVILPKGTWSINDMLFTEGVNPIYFNTFDVSTLTWGDFNTNSITWGAIKEKRIFEWYKSNGDGTFVQYTWDTASDLTWDDVDDEQWASFRYMADITKEISDTFVSYDWGDL